MLEREFEVCCDFPSTQFSGGSQNHEQYNDLLFARTLAFDELPIHYTLREFNWQASQETSLTIVQTMLEFEIK